jgi:antitoxin VapB
VRSLDEKITQVRTYLREVAMETAKVFWSGRSQAVGLPKQFRVEGQEVHVRRRGNAIILEPAPASWSWLVDVVGTLDEDFVAAVQEQPQAIGPTDVNG